MNFGVFNVQLLQIVVPVNQYSDHGESISQAENGRLFNQLPFLNMLNFDRFLFFGIKHSLSILGINTLFSIQNDECLELRGSE